MWRPRWRRHACTINGCRTWCGSNALSTVRAGYRSGAVVSPTISAEEPLARLAAHFVHCIATGATPLTDGTCALRVLAIADAVEQRLAAKAMTR